MNDINLVKGEKKSKLKFECYGKFWIRSRFAIHADPKCWMWRKVTKGIRFKHFILAYNSEIIC
jgi:hypothetical protein